ncbi:hypothetical protein M9458_052418 [Cirrhinus mrigala]|uniref:Uncharacterized protein n=1 Tax=Cirrhinus mrigala TaxID=683832 RepID=A0ABD0MSY7_CIRMR
MSRRHLSATPQGYEWRRRTPWGLTRRNIPDGNPQITLAFNQRSRGAFTTRQTGLGRRRVQPHREREAGPKRSHGYAFTMNGRAIYEHCLSVFTAQARKTAIMTIIRSQEATASRSTRRWFSQGRNRGTNVHSRVVFADRKMTGSRTCSWLHSKKRLQQRMIFVVEQSYRLGMQIPLTNFHWPLLFSSEVIGLPSETPNTSLDVTSNVTDTRGVAPTSELLSCPVMAIEAVIELSDRPVTAMEAVSKLCPSCHNDGGRHTIVHSIY